MRRSPFARMRAKRREMPTVELSLAAMVDMMINLLIFLLHLYGGGAAVDQSDDLQLAKSTATEPVHVRVPVVISRTAIGVSGREVVALLLDGERSFVPADAVENGAVPALTDAIRADLERQRERQPSDRAAAELVIQADRRATWTVLGPVLRSAAAAGVEKYRFVVASEGETRAP